jgi:hypothetical protein
MHKAPMIPPKKLPTLDAVSITKDEREALMVLDKADRVIMNKQARLTIDRAKTQQDIAEFHQTLSDRYGLKDGDVIDKATGRITKKPA